MQDPHSTTPLILVQIWKICWKTPSEVFPMRDWCGQNFGPKNCNIWSEKLVEISQKSSKNVTCVGLCWKLIRKGKEHVKKGFSCICEAYLLINDWWWHFLVPCLMSWLNAPIWVNAQHFFTWEPFDNLFRNLMGRLFSMKGSDCTIFHIFSSTFECASQTFQDLEPINHQPVPMYKI